jgi:hypothetical protein
MRKLIRRMLIATAISAAAIGISVLLVSTVSAYQLSYDELAKLQFGRGFPSSEASRSPRGELVFGGPAVGPTGAEKCRAA